MGIEIKIDHKTVRDLMDADPEFKVKVKQAILETAVKHESYRMVDVEMRKIIDAEISQAYNVMFKYMNGKRLIPDHIKEEISRLFSNRVQEAVNKCCSEAMESIRKKTEERAAYIESVCIANVEKVVNKAVAQTISDKVDERIAAVVNALKGE